MLASTRRFFAERGVMEVETPLLSPAAGTDPNLQLFEAEFRLPGQSKGVPHYLQTSPEFAMKRLLAAGSGCIYQICKAFRNEETGRLHNPEFTLLEWYRVGFDLDALMDEVDALLQTLLGGRLKTAAERVAYRDVFVHFVGVDPIRAEIQEFIACAERLGLSGAENLCGDDRTIWLDLLFSHVLQPQLGRGGRASFVYDYPSCLPSLARMKPGEPEVVERVEVFIDGLETGNGYHELADAMEQDRRFEADLLKRKALGLDLPRKDRLLLEALEAGLPDCSGMALGLDRLLMFAVDADAIAQVLAFPLE